MFYAHFVLSKKGPLARIWLAAHWDKKLTKAHVFETNIESSVEAIIQPKVKLALRTSGHLLLGVVRIYSRKAKYLLADCNEAFVKIKMAFRPGVVDLPEENREAAVNTITLPETFHDFETTMADLNDIDVQAQFNVNQSRPEEITMREDLGNITLVGDDGFGELGGFGAGADNMLQDVHMDDTLYVRNPDSVLPADHQDDLGASAAGEKEQDAGGEKPMEVDPFASVAPAAGAEAAMPEHMDDYEGPAGIDDDDSDHDDGGDFGGGMDTELFGGDFGETGGLFEEPPPVPEVSMPPPAAGPEIPTSAEAQPSQQQVQASPGMPPVDVSVSGKDAAPEDETHLPDNTTASTIRGDQTTLLPNEAEAFALEPIDVTSLGTERKAKRKRKLIIDDQKGIASETMKMQLSDTSDIITTLDLAPPTKKLMHWKETGGVEKLFALSGRPLVSKRTTKLFNKNLVTRAMSLMEEEQEEQLELEEEHHPVHETIPEPVHEPVLEPVHVPVPEETPVMPVPEPVPDMAPSVTSMVEQPSMRERETARAEQSSIEEPVLEPPSMLEDQPSMADASRPSISMVADASLVSNTTANTSAANTSDANTTLQPELAPELPELAPELEPEPLGSMSRRYSTDDEDNDADDIFNVDLPEVNDAASDGGHTTDNEEEAEERRWNKRTQQMSFILNRSFSRGEPNVHFSSLVRANNRKQVASKFYTLLVLKKLQAVEVCQPSPYADIAISQGPKFEALV